MLNFYYLCAKIAKYEDKDCLLIMGCGRGTNGYGPRVQAAEGRGQAVPIGGY